MDALREILPHDWDPDDGGRRLDLCGETARGRYDVYLRPLAAFVASGAGEEAIKAFLAEREAESMCFPSLRRERLRSVAQNIVSALRTGEWSPPTDGVAREIEQVGRERPGGKADARAVEISHVLSTDVSAVVGSLFVSDDDSAGRGGCQASAEKGVIRRASAPGRCGKSRWPWSVRRRTGANLETKALNGEQNGEGLRLDAAVFVSVETTRLSNLAEIGEASAVITMFRAEAAIESRHENKTITARISASPTRSGHGNFQRGRAGLR